MNPPAGVAAGPGKGAPGGETGSMKANLYGIALQWGSDLCLDEQAVAALRPRRRRCAWTLPRAQSTW